MSWGGDAGEDQRGDAVDSKPPRQKRSATWRPAIYVGGYLFDEVIIGGTRKRAIPLATRLGDRIENELRLPLTADELAAANRQAAIAGARWRRRVQPNGNYNCAGHVWASRRTCIFERREWDKILAQDGYARLNENAKPLPGDLAIYRLPDYGIIHIGEILHLEGEQVQVPVVLSKWSDWTGEYEHKEHDVPFGNALPGYIIEYWTERFRGHTP